MDVMKIREQFPILKRKINGKPIIYFDNACMTLKPKQVIEALEDYYYNYSACAGRSIHKLGSEVTIKYDEAREKIGKFINVKEARDPRVGEPDERLTTAVGSDQEETERTQRTVMRRNASIRKKVVERCKKER